MLNYCSLLIGFKILTRSAFIFFLLTLSVLSKSQPDLIWAKELKGNNVGLILNSNSVIGNSGGVYTIGAFSGTVDFDPGPLVNNLTSNSGKRDLFICKLNSNGSFLWAKQIHGTNNTYITKPIIDKYENIYFSGGFSGTIDFDPSPSLYFLTSSSTLGDLFIEKLDSNGNFLWAEETPGTSQTNALNIILDPYSFIYVCGGFSGTTDFDPGSGASIFNSKSQNEDCFILKLDIYGNFIWAKQIGGNFNDRSYCLASDVKGNIYISGVFEDTVDFDPGIGINKVISHGNSDIFILKLDSGGVFDWVKCIGGSLSDGGYAIGVDSFSNIYLAGSFEGVADFDPSPLVYNLSEVGGNSDIFVLKLNSSGNFIWAKQIEGNSAEVVFNLALSDANDIYITGAFGGTSDFDPGTGQYLLSSFGSYDAYICKLKNSGSFEWARQIGGNKSDYSYSILLDSIYIYASGTSVGLTDFDPSDSIYNFNDTNNYAFILKWRICNSSSTITRLVCDSFVFNNQTLKSSGTYSQVTPNYRGCDSTIILNLTVIKKPKVRFVLQSQVGCQYIAYTFIDSSFSDTLSASGYTYIWDYGDGTIATFNSSARIQSFKHTYNLNGTYSVKLLFNNGFCLDSFSILNNVIILPATKPGFTLDKRRGCTPFNLKLQDTLKTNILKKEYNFGNGFVSLNNTKELDTMIQINTPGTYYFNQRLTGVTGCITEFSDTIIIGPGLSNLDKVHLIYSTVLDSFTTYTLWNKLPNAISYNIRNKTITDTFFIHLNAKPAFQSEKYYVSANDSCGNKSSISTVNQTVFLSGENQNYNEYALLKYTPYETWTNGVMEYDVEFFDRISNLWIKLNTLQGNTLISKSIVLSDSLDLGASTSQICYRIRAKEKNGNNQFSLSNVVCIPIYPVVFLPNAFSPNNDGMNDYYKPICAGLNSYIFEIYNRWGTLVYSDTPESKGWDGNFKGEKAEEGTYAYRLSAIGLQKSPATNDARVVERKGTIFLIR